MDKELICRLSTLAFGTRVMRRGDLNPEAMERFAGLVAEECAKTAENVPIPFGHDDGETRAAAAIREQFKP